MRDRSLTILGSLAVLAGTIGLAVFAQPAAAQDKPNIVVIWGDDIGWFNISAYNHGLMGYKTPNIDRLAREGALFTDWYGQQSCTAGRAAFVTGQSPIRTGLLKVGLPGAPEGITEADPTLAGLLKNHGYMTAQYGKNHLGDRDEHLPTNHGFDEFLGNLYHLNAEEEPENPDYPSDFVYSDGVSFKERFGPRGVMRATAGGQIEDTGPLTRKRMETVDEEVTAGALDFIDRAHAADKPFFLWWNSTRMHVWTHLKPASKGVTGMGIYPDGMVEHDGMIGEILDKLDKLGIADNTIVMYSTDNGAEVMSWPDGGATPFRGEKNTNWEGGYRVPTLIRWPGVIKPGTIINEIGSHEDMLPTLMAAVGEPDIKTELLSGGVEAIGRSYNVHIDGYNLLPALKGQAEWPRKEFLYWTDDGSLASLRYNQWKIVFLEQRAHSVWVWSEPFTPLRAPKIFHLRADPFETADHEGIDYERWWFNRLFLLGPAQHYVGSWLQTLAKFPPRQKPGSFNLDHVMAQLQEAGGD